MTSATVETILGKILQNAACVIYRVSQKK